MSRRLRRTSSGTGAVVIKGAIAGAVATWLMGQITSYMYQRSAAEKVAGLAGRSLDEQQRERVGSAIHSWQAHARGLAGHLTFGTVTDATLRVLDAVA